MINSIYSTLLISIPYRNNGTLHPAKIQDTIIKLTSDDDSLWTYSVFERADSVWRAISENDLPRYAALNILKNDPRHPIKYLIMLAAQTYLKNGH